MFMQKVDKKIQMAFIMCQIKYPTAVHIAITLRHFKTDALILWYCCEGKGILQYFTNTLQTETHDGFFVFTCLFPISRLITKYI
jgi:hypothetical protein